MTACVIVGDENKHRNKPYWEKIDKHCHFIKLGIMLKKQQSGQKPKAHFRPTHTHDLHAQSCSSSVQKSKGHTHSRDQHKSRPASKSAMEHASCSRRPLAKRSARERRMDRCTEDGQAGPVSMGHSTALIRKETAHTSSCSCMGPCAVLLCRMLRHGTQKGWALRS